MQITKSSLVSAFGFNERSFLSLDYAKTVIFDMIIMDIFKTEETKGRKIAWKK